jgi:hypothetical protein
MKHPPHHSVVRLDGGIEFTAKPLRASYWLQRRRQRDCHRNGGHWWHPADPMIAWFCCNCGAERDGMPQDGSR